MDQQKNDQFPKNIMPADRASAGPVIPEQPETVSSVTAAPAAVKVFSVISIVMSGLAVLCVSLLVAFIGLSGSMNFGYMDHRVIIIFFLMLGATWIFASLGGLMSVILLIISCVKGYYRVLWMPVLSAVMTAVAIFLAIRVLN